ncbi:hypothetical protein BH18VER1_BH18VER1_07720 [soil metagenome]
MRALFASLLSLLLGSAQCFALKGGPDYSGGGANIVGTYSGVLRGLFDPTNPASSNTIGIFTLGVPQTGNGTGNFLMFARGRTFTGTIDASADPDKATVTGVVSATYDYTLQALNNEGDLVSIPVTAIVNGPINAKASSNSRNIYAAASVLLRGDATLYISGGRVTNEGDPFINEIVALTVSGFKQSNTVGTGG